MIKLNIEIEEENTINLDKISAIGSNINIKIFEKNSTKSEKRILEIIRKRLKLDDKLQFENDSIKSDDEIKREILNYIKKNII